MKLGELKIEALRLMFAGYDDLTIENLSSLCTNENYQVYLIGMKGAINRCFGDIESKGVLPVERAELSGSDGERRLGRVRFDLSLLIGEWSQILRIVRENEEGYEGHCPYDMEGTTAVVKESGCEEEYFTVLYRKKIRRITPAIGDGDEIDLPEEISALIPYYIKGDLFREDEPGEAGEARNFYEAGMEQLKSSAPTDGECGAVEGVYGRYLV